MKRQFAILGLLLTGAAAGSTAWAEDALPATDEATMVALARSWLGFGETFDDESDIPPVLALLHPEFRYTHVEFDAHFDRAGLENGLLRRLERASTKNNHATITNMITGKNMVVVKYDSDWDDHRSGEWVHRTSKDKVTLFEFRADKIWHITEYWD